MEAYGNAMCQGGYVGPCEGDGWSWGGQAWGTGYEPSQISQGYQYDGGGCGSGWGNWDYSQASTSATTTSTAAWDMSQGWDMSQAQQGLPQMQQGFSQPQHSAKTDPEPSWEGHGADGINDQNWNAAEGPRVGAELLTELRLTELKRLIDRDAEALKKSSDVGASVYKDASVREVPVPDQAARAQDNVDHADVAAPIEKSAEGAAVSDDRPKPIGPGYAGGSTSASCEETEAETAGAAAERQERPGIASSEVARREDTNLQPASLQPAAQGALPPGLDAPVEQCYVCLGDFEPNGRSYGEMPVRTGDEIWVDSDPLEEWIFGFKRGDKPDQGWLPASFLGIECDEEADLVTAEGLGARKRGQRSRGGRGRGGVENAGGPASTKGGMRSDAIKEEPWYNHGQWWSKQRHLNMPQENSEPNSNAQPTRRARGRSRDANAAVEDDDPRGGRGGRGTRGRQTAKEAEPVKEEQPAGREKPKRERAALTALMDRLNKPLVVAKPEANAANAANAANPQ